MVAVLVLLASSGLEALALSGDGKLLAVAGRNRAVYVLDAATLEVRQRLGVRTPVRNLAFTADGAALVVEDDRDTLRRFDRATGKPLATLEDARGLTVHPEGKLALVRGANLRSIQLADFRTMAILETTERPAALAFDASGKQIFVLEQSQFTEDEKRVAAADVPEKLRGLEREEFRQRNDGRTCLLRVYDLDGKELRRRRLWYTSDTDSTTLIPRGDEVLILNRGNTVARIDALGTITLSRLEVPVLHARASSPDGKRIALGLRGSVRLWTDKTVDHPFGEPPDEAEFVTRLLVRPDGTIYGVTSAYRVVHIDKAGKVRTMPVF
jgi:DNA-binding beta-propeller fold protein YncE